MWAKTYKKMPVSFFAHFVAINTYKCIIGAEELEQTFEDRFVLGKISLQRQSACQDRENLIQRHGIRVGKDQSSYGTSGIIRSIDQGLILEQGV